MQRQNDDMGPRTGLLGELAVETRLVQNGWHPVRLDTAQMASNADLLAINRKQRIAIQVKTTNGHTRHSHSDWLGFGYSTAYIRDQKSIFNSKSSPLIADIVVGVSYGPEKSRFIVMPVVYAEKLCRIHCDYWYSVPTRTAAGSRSNSFPIYLNLSAQPGSHSVHHDRMKQNLLPYENAWHLLLEPVERLHDPSQWQISD